jgi:hypothetical protein
MTTEEFKGFYLEVVQKYQAIDKKHSEILSAIEAAVNEEELNAIVINYEGV